MCRMPTDPVTTLTILQQFAVGGGSSFASQLVFEAAKAACVGVWRHRNRREDPFITIWKEVAAKVEAPWSPVLHKRIATIKGAFQAGRVTTEANFRDLLSANGIDSDAAPCILAEMQGLLDGALKAYARTNQAAFQPAVLDELASLGFGIDDLRQMLTSIDSRLQQLQGDMTRLIDDLASRPDAMRPPPVEPGRDLSEDERQIITQAAEVLATAPDLISAGRLEDAEKQVAPQQRAMSALHGRLRKDASAATKGAVSVILARVDIQLGAIACERGHYARAADIYQRAVAWAQHGNDEETLHLALHQAGAAFAEGHLFRPAKELFQRALEHEGPNNRPQTLNDLAVCLYELGDRRGALVALEAALKLLRNQADREPGSGQHFAATLNNNRGVVLGDMGRREEALRACSVSLGYYRRLAEAQPEPFRHHLATTLHNCGSMLADVGRRQEALSALQEALDIRRQLAKSRPDRSRPHLAMTLNSCGRVLVEMGRREEALTNCDEALEHYRQLAKAEPEAFRQCVAMVLGNRGGVLLEMGRHEDALATYDEALTICRQLAAEEPKAFHSDVATTLNNRGTALDEAGRREEALLAYDEALTIRRQLANAEPAAFRPDVATTLNNRANVLNELGRHDEALADYDEALERYRQLAQAEPGAFRQYVATTLSNRGTLLRKQGRREDALIAYDEALHVYRQLAEAEPMAFRHYVARALNNRGNVLGDMGRKEDALAAFDEGLAILAELAQRDSQAFGEEMMQVLCNRIGLEGGQEGWEAFLETMQKKQGGEPPADPASE
jgi:tetratricopeptide (TPR) repeat protein